MDERGNVLLFSGLLRLGTDVGVFNAKKKRTQVVNRQRIVVGRGALTVGDSDGAEAHENLDAELRIFFRTQIMLPLDTKRRAMPLSRASLLEAKALPPLIRLRRKLEAATGAVGVADSSGPAAAEPEPERARRIWENSTPAAEAGKGSMRLEGGADLRDRAQRQGESDGVERLHGDGEQPPLEAMVGLIVDQMVGRASSATARTAPVGR